MIDEPGGVRARSLSLLALAVLLVAIMLGGKPAAALADACTPPVANAIACENSKDGDPSGDWEVEGAGDDTIQGFATSMSVNKGSTVSFKIKSATSNYHVDILRLGYYKGDGARIWKAGLTPTNTTAQPACMTDSSTGLIDCGNWSVSLSWTVPSDAVSGVYIAHLVRNDTGGDSLIPFVVRDDSSHSDIVVSTSDATWQAYNTYGGNSLYQCTVSCPAGDPSGYKAAYAVSYNRPFHTAEDDGGRTWLFTGGEYPMIRYLERMGYDVSYISSIDENLRGSLLLNHKLFMSSGHDEYWSQTQRTAMENARNAGVNEAFFSGNEGFWKTRWSTSQYGPDTASRTLISYKDTHFTTRQDPVEWTGSWRDPRFTLPSENVTPENALTGQSFEVNAGSTALTVPYAYKSLRMWKNTDVANLTPGHSVTLADQSLGYEWDVDADNGFRPAGLFELSSTTASGLEVFTDYGTGVAEDQTDTHHLSMYRTSSGARVFGAGTVQWSWGLDSSNFNNDPEDRNMQQATRNLFADMGAQAATPIAGLSASPASTDNTAPTSTPTSPPTSATDGQEYTLNGTASDTGGGVVAGVEVSTDGGTTWHAATGTTSWTYKWIAHGAPTATIKTRAVDDSGNLQTPGAGTAVTINCPCSIWGSDFDLPTGAADSGDPSGVELGLKFTSDVYGQVTGVRFYKSSLNTGTHVGSLWSSDGTRLAQATFAGETSSGWQSVTFSQPVAIQPNTTYIVSYYAPNGHYSDSPGYLYRNPAPGPNGGGVADGTPLHAVRNSGTVTNGVYNYGAPSTFPASTYQAGNYWVDVDFAPIPKPGQVTGVTATSGGRTSANLTWTAPSTGGAPSSYKITPYIGSTAQTATTITGTPPVTATTITGLTQGTTYTFTVQAINPAGSGTASASSNSVTPLNPVAPTVPLNVAASPADQSVQVTWTTPVSDGDSAITGYTITPYVAGVAQPTVPAAAGTNSKTISGLDNGDSMTFKVLAANAVGNSPLSAASNAATPNATVFGFTSPGSGEVDSLDNNPVEVGMKFTADYAGTVTGVRFYKSAANTGTHVGTLWSASGTQLAQATFTSETAGGWQAATFSSPVSITAGTTYVISYHAPAGRYSATGGSLFGGLDHSPLHALAGSNTANGLYAYSSTSIFPTNTYNSANYWVDVLYALPDPGRPTGVTAAEGGRTSANVTWTAPASGGPVISYKVTPFIGATAQTPKIVTGTPLATATSMTGLTQGATYTFTVQALNENGGGQVSAASNAVTPQNPVVPSAPTAVSAKAATGAVQVDWTTPANDGDSAITGYTITPYIGTVAQTAITVSAASTSKLISNLPIGVDYTYRVKATNGVGDSPQSAPSNLATPSNTIFDFATPSTIDSGDNNPVEVGVKFKTSFAGTITGIRFYKATTNTGTHVGTLWSASGTQLAQATFANESASGWQTATFSTPVNVTAATTYVASYYAPEGHYAVSAAGLSAEIDNGPLSALADGANGGNGVFRYGAGGGFPTGTYAGGNYWVDVTYEPAPAPGQVTGVTATAGQASANVSWTAPSTGGPPASYTITPYIGATAQTPVTITGNPPATTKTITGLTPGTAYTFTVTASNPTGSGTASAHSGSVTPLGAVAPGAPTALSAQADSKGAIVSWTAPASDGGSALTTYTVTPYIGTTAQTTTPVTAPATSVRVAGLTNGTAYTFKVTATNAAGSSPASAASSAATPQASVFESGTPVTVDSGDANSVVLGVKFTADVSGTITGIRFYKSAANTGTHIGALWSVTGTQLAQATFSHETASGWQAVSFATPVSVTAGTTYVASYLAPNGHYSVSAGGLSTAVDNGQLHALADGANGGNGVFAYSSTMTMPLNGGNAGNYWVDVLFAPGV
jgi:hypothetical protein